jgi:hypothetical protein
LWDTTNFFLSFSVLQFISGVFLHANSLDLTISPAGEMHLNIHTVKAVTLIGAAV